MNALHCLENLYVVVPPSASQVNTRTDFAAILKPGARSRGLMSTNQTSETFPSGHANLKRDTLQSVTAVKNQPGLQRGLQQASHVNIIINCRFPNVINLNDTLVSLL